ncbi:MAG: TolC family protein, partial [Planctomycetaceae bacterium]
SYTGSLSADYRQPLWAGFGTAFTRTAGPLRGGFAAITGVSQGVVIARINNDITIADFEAAVRNQLKDVEDTYWFLYLAYRDYDTAVAARDATLRIWERTKEIIDVGGLGALPGGLGPAVTPADEAQARDQYFFARAAAERALNTIYEQELRLRRLLGLPVNDGKVIRPVTEPITAEFIPDWYVCLAEALTQRVELRRQKWQIKSLELQLAAAKSLTNPRLDLVGNYRVNAFGDQLLGESDDDEAGTVQGLDSAYETLTQGDQTGWMLGFEFSMPIGFRQAHAQVRNYELRLAKARDVLATQEREISHELAFAIQDLVVEYQTARTNLSRREAARRRVELFQIQVDEGEDAQDELLRALQSLAEAESAYFSSLVGYQQAIAQLEFFKGTLLEWNNVHLAEGPWNPKAYQQALQRAMARSHAMPAPWLETEPHEFELPGPPQIHLPAHVPPGSVIPEEPRHPPEQAPPPAPKPPAAPDLPPGGDVTGNVRLYD